MRRKCKTYLYKTRDTYTNFNLDNVFIDIDCEWVELYESEKALLLFKFFTDLDPTYSIELDEAAKNNFEIKGLNFFFFYFKVYFSIYYSQ
jgi:hypothetical protein